MKLVTYQGDGVPCLGASVEGGIVDLSSLASRRGVQLPNSMQCLIEAGPKAWQIARELIADSTEADHVAGAPLLLAPLPRPVRLRDASLFLEHMEVALTKAGLKMSPQFYEQVIYYNADNVHVSGHEAAIKWPSSSQHMDYELEWACVIGKGGADIAREDAAAHIFGFTIFNDWSARDLQFPFMEACLGPGAGKDFANTFGPCIATPDEFSDPYSLTMTARINGEIWSRGSTSTMHWSFEDAVSMLSRDRPLIPGEIIGSGTVLGGCGFEIDRKLNHGDIVELEVQGIGILRNSVA